MKIFRQPLWAVLPFFILCGFSYAGDKKDLAFGDITLGVVVPAQSEPLPEEIESYITEKLVQMASANGVSADKVFSRFFVAAKIDQTFEDFEVGPPSRITQKATMTLYIADYLEHKVLASAVVSAEGEGSNEGNSLYAALQNIPDTSALLHDFFANGLREIVYYYNEKGDRVIQQARVLAAQNRYEEALFHLVAIPEAAGAVYTRAQHAISQIFQQYVDYKGTANISDTSVREVGEAYAKSQQTDIYMKWLR